MNEMAFDDTAVRRRRRRRTHWLRHVTRRPRHWIREHKALSVLMGFALLLLIILLIWLWILNNKLDNVPRFEADLGERPPYLGIGTNILLVGVDDGKEVELDEMLESGEWRPGVFRSDTVMLAHLSEDRSQAQVVSIPRDSYVAVEGHGRTKINAAFSYGGPELLGKTVEDLTGVFINHIFIADFQGFEGITEAIGGVPIYIPEDVVDTRFDRVFWKKGWHTLQGEPALEYVRARYGLPRGDFDRVQRQQNMLRGIANRTSTMAVLANPFALTGLVEEITGHLAVDDSVTNGVMRTLAWDARNLRSSDIMFATAPNDGSATINGASVVKLRTKQVKAMFEAIAHDRFEEYVTANTVEMLPGEQQVD